MNIPISVDKIPNSMFENCSSLGNIEIPVSIKEIGSDAFKNCSSITAVNIPVSVKSIGGEAFDKCNSLMEVTAQSALPVKITSSTFSKATQKEGRLHVKASSVNNYQLDKQWGKFLNIVGY